MQYFDLHCDTISECHKQKSALFENGLHLDLKRAAVLDSYVQCYAAFIPDSLSGDAAFFYFCALAKKLQEEVTKNQRHLMLCANYGDLKALEEEKKFGAILTVENGRALGGKLENISALKSYGVKMLTLTWNGENEIGCGIGAARKKGLTDFGKKALPLLEENGIVIDLSHAGKRLFYDVLSVSEKPVVASHSNAKSLCKHRRNLTNEQFLMIKRKKGLVGLNFYPPFLNDKPEEAALIDILRHAEYFLSLGGADILCMGSDFDGADLPRGIDGIQSVPTLYEFFLRKNYPETLVKKIFFGNAADFFRRNKLL